MTYLVMECHDSHAVVLSEDGRFLTVPNLNYEQGQVLTRIIDLNEPRSIRTGGKGRWHQRWAQFKESFSYPAKKTLGLAAALLLVVGLVPLLVLSPYGTVQLAINPEVEITVNRFNQVLDLEGLNKEGKRLVSEVNVLGKGLKQTVTLLSERAAELGFLQEQGRITITADGSQSWRQKTEQTLQSELQTHFEGWSIEIVIGEESTPEPQSTPIVIPVVPQPTPTPVFPSSEPAENADSSYDDREEERIPLPEQDSGYDESDDDQDSGYDEGNDDHEDDDEETESEED